MSSLHLYAASLNNTKKVHNISIRSGEKQENKEDVLIDTFDLALKIHSLGFQEQYVMPGHQVTFYIDVINQGNISAQNIVIHDYIPSELILNDDNWISANTNRADYTIAGPIAPGQTETIEITFDITSPLQAYTNIVNWAEIGMSEDVNGNINPIDIDSTPDNNNNNDIFITDNDVNGNANIGEDEDDHDPTQVIVMKFDLALNIVLTPNTLKYVEPNGFVTYRINIFNQGQIDASNVEITDYIPEGLTLVDTDWQLLGDKATYTLQDIILVGDSKFVDITFQLDSGLDPHTEITNIAEISNHKDELNNSQYDVDSTPDILSDNDIFLLNNAIDGDGLNEGDEDDYDIENIFTYSFDLALKVNAIPYNEIIYPGDTLIDRIFIYNQGQIDATNIKITEYLISDFLMVDPTWSTTGNLAQTHLTDTLMAGDSLILDIMVMANPNITTCEVSEHWVEISGYTALSSVYQSDYDSEADTIAANDIFIQNDDINGSILQNGDEDDHDKSSFSINQHILNLQDQYFLTCDQPILELCYTPYIDSSIFTSLVWTDNNENTYPDTCIQITTGGAYVLRYTNENANCYDINRFTVIDNTSTFNIQDTIVDITCSGMTDGSITLEVNNNNNPDYTINWNTNDTTFAINNLSAGIYSGWITDSLGCSEEFNYTITEPDALLTTSVYIVDDQDDSNMGSINLSLEGGTSPYAVTLEDGITLPQNLSAGSYNCLVTDANGCTQIFGPYALNNIVNTDQTVVSDAFLITPNPFNNELNIISKSLKEVKIEIINLQGKILKTKILQKNKSDITVNTSSLDFGIYFIKISTPDSQFIHKMIKAA